MEVHSDSHDLYLNFQRIFRCLDFGRSLQGKVPAITVSQMRILSFFNENDVVHISDISKRLGMSVQSVNNLVSRLETQGYVERTPNQKDKRISDVSLTRKGRMGFEAFRDGQIDILATVTNHLDASEQKMLYATIENAALMLEKAISRTRTENNKE